MLVKGRERIKLIGKYGGEGSGDGYCLSFSYGYGSGDGYGDGYYNGGGVDYGYGRAIDVFYAFRKEGFKGGCFVPLENLRVRRT